MNEVNTDEAGVGNLGDVRLDNILRAVRENPAIPLTLRCNVTGTYAFQNPGHDDDTPEGELFNARRDLRILQRMGMVPGDTRPAIEIFRRLLENIESARGILWLDDTSSESWKGANRNACHYDEGRALGLDAIIPPRDKSEMRRAKSESTAAMYKAGILEIRPHHLMCMSCFYGDREKLAPIEVDNLFEAIDIIQKNPEIPIRLICGPCMICPPCYGYSPKTGLCSAGVAMSLRDELKDLDVLQKLGMKYGDVIPAGKLYSLLYDRIASTTEICGHGDDKVRGLEWHVCRGAGGSPGYLRARKEGLGFLNRRDSSTM